MATEPAINRTVTAYVHERLRRDIPSPIVRVAAIKAFVEPFAVNAPDQSFVPMYRDQIAQAVDSAIAGFSRVTETDGEPHAS